MLMLLVLSSVHANGRKKNTSIRSLLLQCKPLGYSTLVYTYNTVSSNKITPELHTLPLGLILRRTCKPEVTSLEVPSPEVTNLSGYVSPEQLLRHVSCEHKVVLATSQGSSIL